MDIDRIGEADRQFAHVLGARHDDGVVAGGAGIEERHRTEAEEVVRRRIRRPGCWVCRIGRSCPLAQEGCGIEGQQHRHRARRDVGEALAGGAIELRHRPPGTSAVLERIDRRAARGRPRPSRPASSEMRGLFISCAAAAKMLAASARPAIPNPRNMTPHTSPERSSRRPGQDGSIAAGRESCQVGLTKIVPQCCKSAAATLIGSERQSLARST